MFRILPHRPYTRIKGQVSVRGANGEMAIQMYPIWTKSGPSLFPNANRQSVEVAAVTSQWDT